MLKLAPLGVLTGLGRRLLRHRRRLPDRARPDGGHGMTLANAAASSLVSVALFGAATSLNYALIGTGRLALAGLLLIGGVLGGFVGLRLASLIGPPCGPGAAEFRGDGAASGGLRRLPGPGRLARGPLVQLAQQVDDAPGDRVSETIVDRLSGRRSRSR